MRNLAWAPFVGILLLAGCYSYDRVPAAQVHPGEEVTASLNPSGAEALDRAVGPRVTKLDGQVVAITDSAVTLGVTSLWRTTSGTSNEELWSGDNVIVPASAMDSLRVKRIDRTRSWLVAAGAVAFAVVTRAVTAGDAFGRGGSAPPPVTR
jgi:uncharacterized membrane protein